MCPRRGHRGCIPDEPHDDFVIEGLAEIDEPRAVAKRSVQSANGCLGESGLADTARAGKCEEAGAHKKVADLSELMGPTDKRSRFTGNVVHSPLRAIRASPNFTP